MTGPLRERADALALIAEEAGRARAGRGRLVLLRGATGTGRTAVLEAAARHASGQGLRVLRVRCSPGGDRAPLATARQLLAHATGHPRRPAPDADAGADTSTGAELLWEDLRGRSADGPLMLAVDDAHLADEGSRRWLAEVARRVDALPVLVVATERSQYDVEPSPPGLAHALPPDLVRTHTLAPLSPGAATALVRAARPGAAEAWIASVVRAGARTPLLLRALLEDLAGTAPLTVPDASAALYPGAYPAAVAWWLEGAGPLTTRVARTLAALEHAADGTSAGKTAATDPGVLARAARAEPPRTTGWLTATTGLGLLVGDPADAVRFAHPLLRDAVLAGWPLARRQEAHRSAAEAMLGRGARAEPVARQLLHAGPVREPWAPRVLGDAATLALGESRVDDAVAFLRRSLREPLSDEPRQRLLTELGSLEYAAADPADGIPHLAEAVHLPAPARERVDAAIALGTALFGRGEDRAGARLLSGVAQELTGHPDPARAARTALAHLADRDPAMRRDSYRWLADAAEKYPDTVGPAGRALLLRHAALAGACPAPEAVRRVRALLAEPSDPLTEPFLLATVAAVAQWTDELDEAERLVDRGLAGQRPSLLHPMQQALHHVRADIAAARGAYGWLLAASRARPAASRERGPANLDAHALVALVETGRTREAGHFAEGFDLRGAPDSWELNRFLYARGLLRRARGEVTGALHDFLECGRRQAARAVVSPAVTPWRTAAAECRLRLGAREEAVALAEEELRLAVDWDTPRTTGRALRVLGTVTGGAPGRDLLGEAVSVLRGAPAEGELAEALLAHGRALTVAGDQERGRTLLREAAVRAGRLGAVRLRLDAERALGPAGAPPPATRDGGPGSLTRSERRIARLAVEGRTNGEIAALLHVALRTVETHLTHTYRKLGIRRRMELRTALGREPYE